MRCPQCGARETRVVDSRDLDESATIRRRRECASCSNRFTTYERVETARLVVVKREGIRQEFDRAKLASGIRKALTRRPVPDTVADQAERGRQSLEHVDANHPSRFDQAFRGVEPARPGAHDGDPEGMLLRAGAHPIRTPGRLCAPPPPAAAPVSR